MNLRERDAARREAARVAAEERAKKREATFLSEENQSAIRSLRESERYGRFVAGVPDRGIGLLAEDIKATIDRAFGEVGSEPDLKRRFEGVLLEGNHEALRENGNRQSERMCASWERDQGSDPSAGERLSRFREFVAGLAPIRGDRPNLAYEEFVSPRESGSISSFGPQDVLVQADRYVYGSFDGIAHAMSGRPEGAYRLDEVDLRDRAQIVMQDIANVIPRARDNPIGRYLDNVFDYENGKEIIARYLSMAFESPDEAREFLRRNNGMQQAQQWDRGMLRAGPGADVPYQDGDTAETIRARYDAEELFAQNRVGAIEAKMSRILAETGIEPPLSLEIRVPDRVKIVRREDANAAA